MNRVSINISTLSRILISMVFLLNAFGIIDQTIPAKELAERGAPAGIVPLIMMSGRIFECVAGIALALGILPRLAAFGLFAFLVPATFVSHSFWLAVGTPAFQGQLINFSKNTAILGGLLFIAATRRQLPLLGQNTVVQRVPRGLRNEAVAVVTTET